MKKTWFLLLCTTSVLANQNYTTGQMMVAVEPLCCHTTTAVDINRFTQLLSNHLLLDHFQKAYSQLSKKISFQFRDAIGLRVRKIKSKKSKGTTTTTPSHTSKLLQQPPVDVQMLKRQIRGAVGCKVPLLDV